VVYLGRHPDDPSGVLAQTESAEAAHWVALVVLVPYIVQALIRREWGAVACLLAVETGFNLYPIMHLRWTRFRLGRFHERMSRRALREKP